MKLFELFSKHIKQTGILSEKEIEEVYACFESEIIPKNHFFLQAGQRCGKIGFLCSGILCSFIYNTEGDEVVKHFLEPNQFFTDLESYEKAQPAQLNIIAVTDAVILRISKQENTKLQNKLPQWKSAQGIFASQALNRMIQMQNFLRFGSAAEQYQYFVKNYPNLARHVPLKYIASYLGITQSSLSRLRRESF
ncbi:MAG: Crp/Fnr family transcriptional regulator [Bacteroidetes bacterium]|nr:Crp/Fnr family transcriptional regulator [Bacteroidota bacterium]